MRIFENINKFFQKEVWHYVGMAEAHTAYVDENGDFVPGKTRTSFFLLYQSSKGRRKFEVQGDQHYQHLASQLANRVHAHVVAWKNGGPFYSEWKVKDPNSTPPNNLIVFQGVKK
jgi:hypothetical protein